MVERFNFQIGSQLFIGVQPQLPAPVPVLKLAAALRKSGNQPTAVFAEPVRLKRAFLPAGKPYPTGGGYDLVLYLRNAQLASGESVT